MGETMRTRIADFLRALARRIEPSPDYRLQGCRCGRAVVEPGHKICDWCEDAIRHGEPLPKHCTRCGILRGTLYHAAYCMGGYCDDPDPQSERVGVRP